MHRLLLPRVFGSLIASLILLAAIDSHDGGALALSLNGRQRRSINGASSVTSTSKSSASAHEHHLIRREEAARIQRIGQAKRRRERNARMEDRVSYLENLTYSSLSSAEQKELEGLLATRDHFEEQYDPAVFSKEHVEFKKMHNDAFVALARFCHNDNADNDSIIMQDPNVFYLDGPDAATSIALQNDGFDPSCCYVANRHLPTCQILRNRLPDENVMHCTAAEALTPIPNTESVDDTTVAPDFNDNSSDDESSFANISFSAYYFDGCGGFVPHIIGMMTAALIRTTATSKDDNGAEQDEQDQRKTTAVGFSLMGGNRDVIQKEMEVCQALSIIARTRGMRTRHVLDDPGRYGIPMDISKTEGGTFTSWILLEKDS